MQNIIRYWKLFFVPVSVLFVMASFTGAYFTNNVSVSGVTFQTDHWAGSISPGDVVINELMWAGSTVDSNDEWIELRNMTSNPIDLSGWQISKLVSSEDPMLTIPSGIIPANGYFLISKFSKDSLSSALNVMGLVDTGVGLRNSNMQIKLYSGSISPANLIDVADDGSGVPLKGHDNGIAGPRQSMSRNAIPGDGTQASSWYTDITSNSTAYWDSADGNYGTPGGQNV